MIPPTIEITGATPKIMVAPPRINLRRAASYNHDKGPLSSTSGRFSFNYLLFESPPPSPGLPQLIPRKRKPSIAPRPSRVMRAVLCLTGIVLVVYVAIMAVWRGPVSHWTSPGLFVWPTGFGGDDEASYEMVSTDSLPDFPTPVVLSDKRGKPIWTVSIPPNYNFPLAFDQYLDICTKCREVAARVDVLRHGGVGANSLLGVGGEGTLKQKLLSYSIGRTVDSDFIDVHEAEVAGFLPGSVSISTLMNQDTEDDGFVGEVRSIMAHRPVCDRTMTFVLASSDSGMGRTLMLLWMSYALAQREGRQFFIDDARWAYGKYTDIFASPPVPDCRPPLRHEMLPCPRQARHIVVTVETASDFFSWGEELTAEAAADHAAHDFALARRGSEVLFHLNREDAEHVADRVKQLKAEAGTQQQGAIGAGSMRKRDMAGSAAASGAVVGMHIRRGDLHPLEYQYQRSYIPLNTYAKRAHDVLETLQNASRNAATSEIVRERSVMIMASDDPMVYESEELVGASRAQDHIQLAGKAEPQQKPNTNKLVIRKFIDESFGWEGGFFSSMFWNLGQSTLSSAASAAAAMAAGFTGIAEAAASQPPSADALKLRSLVGRAYMMDLAVLSKASDTVVCGVSATGCRLLAVLMGWDAAVEEGRWINIDGDYGWWAVDF